jgi:outer membrane receptor protein involved in Fe transport
MVPHEKTWNFFGNGRFQINNDWQAYATAFYSRDETRLVIQPGPVSSLFTYGPLNNIPSTITLQPSSAFYPHDIAASAGVDGEPLDIRYRTFDNGFRDTTDTNENWELIGGVKGTWRNWDIDGSLFYAEGKTTERINGGFQDYTRLLPILNSGVVNFFGPNTPDIVALERSANFVGDAFHGTSKNYGGQLKTSGEIYKLPAGPLALAFGVDARREEFDQIMDPALESGNITGYGGPIKSTRDKSRDEYAAFGELNIPIVRTLEANAAVRYDHYSDFGSTTNPKFSVRWQPTRSLLVRGSYGTGFLAPTLYQLFTPQFGGVTQNGLTDPVRCPVTMDTGLDCSTQFGVLFGGNANLKPEESEQTSVGIVFEPIANASISLDWFKINLKNTIVNGIAPLTVLGDLDQFGSLVTRGPADPNFPGLPGRITQINQLFINLGAERIEGLDIEAHYRTPAMSWGRMSFNVSGTYYTRYDAQNVDGSYTSAVGNTYGTAVTGVVPRWKQYASATWERGPWSATLANTYQTAYIDQATDINGVVRSVGSLSLWDLQGAYTGFRNWKLTLGVKNLFDRNPPQSNQQSTFILGFDPTYYDPRARFVYGSVTYRFKVERAAQRRCGAARIGAPPTPATRRVVPGAGKGRGSGHRQAAARLLYGRRADRLRSPGSAVPHDRPGSFPGGWHDSRAPGRNNAIPAQTKCGHACVTGTWSDVARFGGRVCANAAGARGEHHCTAGAARHPHRGHRLQHQARRERRRVAGHGDHAARHRALRRDERDGVAAAGVGEQQPERGDARQLGWRHHVLGADGIVAGARRGTHAGADQRPSARQLRRRASRCPGRQPQRHSVPGHRARRDTEGRRVGDQRLGRHRRGHQLHHAHRLHRCGSHGGVWHADARRRR